MTSSSQILTAEDLWRLNPPGRSELVKGELHTMAPAGFEHGAVIIRISSRIDRHVVQNKLGIVLGAETGFILAREPDTVRGADVSFVAASRIPAELPKAYFPGPPDLAVEVVSPGDTLQEVEDKVDDYLAAGAKLVWVINPRRRTVTIHTPAAPSQMLHETDTLDGGTVLPGFTCPIAEFFA